MEKGLSGEMYWCTAATLNFNRAEANELMLQLEPMNPTDKPARSPVLNGVWEFLYTGGLGPGTLAVQVRARSN